MRPKRVRWPLHRLVRVIGSAFLLATFVQELRKPREQRTWHGNVFGFIPYDYRPPTLTRIKESFWNPADHHLFTPRPMGIGWAVNFYELRRRLSGGSSSDRGGPAHGDRRLAGRTQRLTPGSSRWYAWRIYRRRSR